MQKRKKHIWRGFVDQPYPNFFFMILVLCLSPGSFRIAPSAQEKASQVMTIEGEMGSDHYNCGHLKPAISPLHPTSKSTGHFFHNILPSSCYQADWDSRDEDN